MPSYFVPDLSTVAMSRCLGVIFDQFLFFEPHINNVAGKLSKVVKMNVGQMGTRQMGTKTNGHGTNGHRTNGQRD